MIKLDYTLYFIKAVLCERLLCVKKGLLGSQYFKIIPIGM